MEFVVYIADFLIIIAGNERTGYSDFITASGNNFNPMHHNQIILILDLLSIKTKRF